MKCEHGCGTELELYGPLVFEGGSPRRHTPERCQRATRALLDEARATMRDRYETAKARVEDAEKRAADAEEKWRKVEEQINSANEWSRIVARAAMFDDLTAKFAEGGGGELRRIAHGAKTRHDLTVGLVNDHCCQCGAAIDVAKGEYNTVCLSCDERPRAAKTEKEGP